MSRIVQNWDSLPMESMIAEIIRQSFTCYALPHIVRGTLQKLCYLCDSEHFLGSGESISGETYVHGRNGPIPIHFDRTVDELITDDRIVLGSDGTFRPGPMLMFGSSDLRDNLQMDDMPRGYHVLPDLDLSETETVSHVVGRYAFMDLRELEALVKRDPPWRLAAEGQALDLRLAFYREEADI